MYVIARQHALDDMHVQFRACLTDDVSDLLAHWALQDFMAIFCCPNHVIPMIKPQKYGAIFQDC